MLQRARTAQRPSPLPQDQEATTDDDEDRMLGHQDSPDSRSTARSHDASTAGSEGIFGDMQGSHGSSAGSSAKYFSAQTGRSRATEMGFLAIEALVPPPHSVVLMAEDAAGRGHTHSDI